MDQNSQSKLDNYDLIDKKYITNKKIDKHVGYSIKLIPLDENKNIISGILVKIIPNILFSNFKLSIKLYNGKIITIKPIKYDVYIKQNEFFKFIDSILEENIN